MPSLYYTAFPIMLRQDIEELLVHLKVGASFYWKLQIFLFLNKYFKILR